MNTVLVIAVVVIVSAAAFLAHQRTARSAERAVHRHSRRDAHRSVFRIAVEQDSSLAGEFSDEAKRQLIDLDETLRGLNRRTARGDHNAQVALVVLNDTRRGLVADIEWSQHLLTPSRGAV